MARRKASKGPTKDAIRPQIKLCALQLRITEVCDRKTIVQLRMDALVQRCPKETHRETNATGIAIAYAIGDGFSFQSLPMAFFKT